MHNISNCVFYNTMIVLNLLAMVMTYLSLSIIMLSLLAMVITYLSLSIMVLSLWAMVITVQSTNCSRMVFWMRSSVSRSTAAVASSRTKIRVLRSRARARHTSCL